jgi:hypothetical protein
MEARVVAVIEQRFGIALEAADRLRQSGTFNSGE